MSTVERYSGPRRAMLVTDSEAAKTLYINILTNTCEVHNARTLVEAFQLIEPNDIKLVLVTLGNAHMDSEAFFRRLKGNHRTADMPFVFVSKPTMFPPKEIDPMDEIARINQFSPVQVKHFAAPDLAKAVGELFTTINM